MRLFYFHLQTEEFRMLPARDGTFAERPGGFQVFATHHSRQLVYNQSSFQHPAEFYLLDLEGSEPKPISQFNDEVAAVNQIRVDEVRFQLDESTVRTGYLIQPAGAPFPPQNVPIVIHHQGGPGGAMTIYDRGYRQADFVPEPTWRRLWPIAQHEFRGLFRGTYSFGRRCRHDQSSSSSSLTEGATGPLPPRTSSACFDFESRMTLTTPAAKPSGMRASMIHGAVPKYLSAIHPRPMPTTIPTRSSVTALKANPAAALSCVSGPALLLCDSRDFPNRSSKSFSRSGLGPWPVSLMIVLET
jgi:hypothetical protein